MDAEKVVVEVLMLLVRAIVLNVPVIVVCVRNAVINKVARSKVRSNTTVTGVDS